jgi:hypothetical protein
MSTGKLYVGARCEAIWVVAYRPIMINRVPSYAESGDN